MSVQKFRKLPVEIEAIQYCWTPGAVQEIQEWGAHVEPTEHWFGACGEPGHEENTDLYVVTLEGRMLTRSHDGGDFLGDWIIKGVQGEFYPCKPDIFEQTYERV